ncbi:MAG: DUF4922 domain-containing protein, partial [Muribaculaceae bacterium]|nr:DUF4922 domain-containing protein [Muribaculaceae bacterium]
AADVSDEAIKARPCFLCTENQPCEQEAIKWDFVEDGEVKRQFKIQVNPYPIFKRHLTIASLVHEPQICNYNEMMSLAHDLPTYVILFNGKGCGASAPDHMHYQATLQHDLPLCDELESLTDANRDSCYGDKFWMGNFFSRQLIYIRTDVYDSAVFWDMSMALHGKMRNAMCWYKEGMWHFVYFPRSAARPKCYGTAPEQFLVSPAIAEYAGVWALPRKEDFDKITAANLISFYSELSCTDDEMDSIYYNYVRVN